LLIGVGVRANTSPGAENSPGPKNGFNASYIADAMRVTPQDAEQQWTFSLVIKTVNGYKPVSDPLMTTQKNKVQFDHDHHFKVEYTHDEQGIRQRFIIGDPGETDGKLTVQLQSENNWHAMYTSANSLSFGNDDQILNYGDLDVQDAKGKKLPAHFTVQHNQIEIAVDAEQVAYPVSVATIVGTLTERHARTVLERNQAGMQLGAAVSAAGDINGDGYKDVVVGAPYYSNGQTAEGAVFVYYGAANGIAPNALFTVLERNVANGHFGEVISGGGDVNGDGYNDVVVGAPYKTGMPGSDTGYVNVYYGSAAGINPTPYIIRSARQGDNFGASVSLARLDGDMLADIAIGANSGAGYVTIYYGTVWGLNSSLIIEVEPGGTTGFGTRVLISGDIEEISGNFLLATAGEDVHVFYQTGQEMDPDYHRIIHSPVPGISFGSSLAAQHDIDGDGYNDIVVGAKDDTNGSLNHAGAVYVFRGGLDFDNGTPSFLTPWRIIKGDQDSALLGAQVAFAGDVNNDGHADLLVSSPAWDNTPAQPNMGKVWLYYGKSSGLDSLPAATIQSTQANSWLGSAITGAGDVDHDGYDDILVGAPLYDKGQVDEGVALIYLGGAYSLARMANTQSDDVVETKTSVLVKTFPNPVLNNLSVQFGGLDAGADTYIQLSDVNGSIVKTVKIGKMDSGNQTIDVSALVPGTYFMIINNGNKVFREKIIKQ
jgi:hypothetical protein